MRSFNFLEAKNKVKNTYQYRNGQPVIDVVVLEKANAGCNVISIHEGGGAIIHQSNGSIMSPQTSGYDLLIVNDKAPIEITENPKYKIEENE